MTPAELDHDENWNGGYYELGFELGPTDDARLERTLVAVWREAAIEGCVAIAGRSPLRHTPTPLTLAALESNGHLRGVVRLPGGSKVVCGVVAVRFEHGADLLELYVPLGALALTDPRVGGFPVGDDGGPVSLSWRRPIDEWLADVAFRVYAAVPFRLALMGMEAAGEADADSVAAGIPDERYNGYVVPTSTGLEYVAANRSCDSHLTRRGRPFQQPCGSPCHQPGTPSP